MARSERDYCPPAGNRNQDPAVEALRQSVHTVCQVSNGYLVAESSLVPSGALDEAPSLHSYIPCSVVRLTPPRFICSAVHVMCRMTSKAVVLDVSTNYSIEETALFYADKKLHQRHMKMQVPAPPLSHSSSVPCTIGRLIYSTMLLPRAPERKLIRADHPGIAGLHARCGQHL
jgi:hypothetical protein